MNLLFVADGRSPIALNWIRYFIQAGHEVHLASTFPSQPDLNLASYHDVRLAFSGVKAGEASVSKAAAKKSLLWGGAAVGLRTGFRQWFGPLTLPGAARRLNAVICQVRPQLIHAMRIPYEGMAAGLSRKLALEKKGNVAFPPLLVSVWGNDFTLHAPKTPLMAYYTRLTLQMAAGLHTDCARDQRLGQAWGFQPEKPAIVLPGSGGVQREWFYPPQERPEFPPVVVNPRGIRAYVRSDTFFRSIPIILERMPSTRFVCAAMAGEPQAQRWVDELGIGHAVELLPQLSRAQMGDLFRSAHVTVSPSTHDGTPNTLLEAMACGSFPVAGDIESLREWITPGENGFLVDPGDPAALARMVLQALDQPALRQAAQRRNAALIAGRAAYEQVMHAAEAFYDRLISA